MERNRNGGRENRVVKEKNGKKKTVNTRRPREGGNRVVSDVIEGMTVMRRFK